MITYAYHNASTDFRGRSGARLRDNSLVALDDGEYVGHITWRLSDGEVISIFVVPERRGENIGRGLITAGVEYTRAHQLPLLASRNPAARTGVGTAFLRSARDVVPDDSEVVF